MTAAGVRGTGLVAGLSVGLEVGPRRRVFGQVVGWPGWARSGRDEARTVRSLADVADRYRTALGSLAAPLGSGTPPLTVMERVQGNATTDFGAVSMLLASDLGPLREGDPAWLAEVLGACWSAFDAALGRVPAAARGTKPPTGRAPDAIRHHLLETDRMHLSAFGPAWKEIAPDQVDRMEPETRAALRDAVRSLPAGKGFEPIRRHGFDWTGPFAVRRACWHALDHAWELEDRGFGEA